VDECKPLRLGLYEQRNDPAHPQGLSGLSPYLHFGHLSGQRAALAGAYTRPLISATYAAVVNEPFFVQIVTSYDPCIL